MTKAMIRILPALALCLPLVLMAQTERQPIDSIVALVEEDVILQSELDQAIDGIVRQVEGRGENLPPRNVLEEQVLERLIMQRLQILRAESTGIRVSDADVDDALNRVARQNELTGGQLRQAVEAEGTSFEQFRSEIRDEIMISRLQQRIMSSMDEISDTEVEILMASDQFGGHEYLLSQIVIAVPESGSPDEVRQAEARIEEIYNRLDEGMSFSSAAISYSQAPDALEGGDVGWRNISALPPVFADAVEGLSPGEVSEPLRTPAGVIILQVRDVRERSEVIVTEYRARHLLISPSELITTDQARERIENLRERIEDGEDFAELAREYSSDQSTANLGGLLDWFPGGAYGPYVREQVESLEPGELSDPFQSPNGWHLIKLLEVRESDRTEEVLRAEARDMLSEQKAQEEVERFMRQLRSESFVEIRL
jgi:peptidyl-prolyl cis-trans isomerase SurA